MSSAKPQPGTELAARKQEERENKAFMRANKFLQNLPGSGRGVMHYASQFIRNGPQHLSNFAGDRLTFMIVGCVTSTTLTPFASSEIAAIPLIACVEVPKNYPHDQLQIVVDRIVDHKSESVWSLGLQRYLMNVASSAVVNRSDPQDQRFSLLPVWGASIQFGGAEVVFQVANTDGWLRFLQQGNFSFAIITKKQDYLEKVLPLSFRRDWYTAQHPEWDEVHISSPPKSNANKAVVVKRLSAVYYMQALLGKELALENTEQAHAKRVAVIGILGFRRKEENGTLKEYTVPVFSRLEVLDEEGSEVFALGAASWKAYEEGTPKLCFGPKRGQVQVAPLRIDEEMIQTAKVNVSGWEPFELKHSPRSVGIYLYRALIESDTYHYVAKYHESIVIAVLCDDEQADDGPFTKPLAAEFNCTWFIKDYPNWLDPNAQGPPFCITVPTSAAGSRQEACVAKRRGHRRVTVLERRFEEF